MMTINEMTVAQTATEYGVQFGSDGPVLECEDETDARIVALMDGNGLARIVKRQVFMTQWETTLS